MIESSNLALDHGAGKNIVKAQLTALVVFMAAPAAAFDVPQYDSQAYCQAAFAMFAKVPNIDVLKTGCLDQEKVRKEQVTRLAPLNYFTDDDFQKCDALARNTPGGSYQALAGCLALNLSQRILEGKVTLVPER